MAASSLSVRTLGLAVVALILACGKAALGDGARVSRPPTYVGGTGSPPRQAGAVPGSSANGTGVATFSSRGGGSSSVKTVTGQRGSGWNPKTVATGQASARAIARPAQQARKSKPGLAHEESSISVRRAAGTAPDRAVAPRVVAQKSVAARSKETEDWARAAREAARDQPVVLAALQTPPAAPALTRNAFAVSGEPARIEPVAPRPVGVRGSMSVGITPP